MITPGIFASIIDINGPDARRYDIRSTVYMSHTGKDGYLGATPDLPTKTLGNAREILRRTKASGTKKRSLLLKGGEYSIADLNPTSEEFNYSDNNITDDTLTISPYNSEQVNIVGNYYKISDITVTPNELWKLNITVKTLTEPVYITTTSLELIAIEYGDNYTQTFVIDQYINLPMYTAVNTIADYSSNFEVVSSVYYKVTTEFTVSAYVYTLGDYPSDTEVDVWSYEYYNLSRYSADLYYKASEYVDNTNEVKGLYKNYYLNDTRLYPARFPKKGAYNYNDYPVNDIPNGRVFRIKDTTGFLSSLAITPGAANTNPNIVVNVDYFSTPGPNNTILNLSSYATNMYAITSNIDITGFSILGYNPNNPVTNLSAVAHYLCTEEGEFVISLENSIPYIYIKPPSSFNILTADFYARGSSDIGLKFNSVNNLKIKDLNIRYLQQGINVSDYSRNVAISGCNIQKCNIGIQVSDAANTNLYKNVVFDINNTGIQTIALSSTKITNNIIKYVGVTNTAQAFGIGVNGPVGRFWGGNNLSPTSSVSSTSSTFTIQLSDVAKPAYAGRYDTFNHDFGGFAEITTGDFAGQKRIVSNYFAYGPGAVDSPILSAVRGTGTYGIVDPWTPVNGKLSPDPGDIIKYTHSIESGNGGQQTKATIDHNYIAYSGTYCTQGAFSNNETISGNYIANASYGYSGDLGVVYHSSGDNLKYLNNIIKNGRRGPGRYNGFTIYLDSQHGLVNVENNIISQSDDVVFCHEANRVTLKNNIIDQSRGCLLGFQHTGQFWGSYRVQPTDYQFHSFNNIFITSSAENFLFYKSDSTVRPTYDYRGFQGYSVYHPALRVVNDNLTADINNYKNFYISSATDPQFVSDWTEGGDKFYRCGASEGRPVYYNGENPTGFYVKNGNWIFGRTSYIKLSSKVGITGYDYPWQLPVSSFYVCNNTTNNYGYIDIAFTFDTSNFNGNQFNKRQVPLFYTHDNCHYTDITNFKTSQYPTLSDNYYAWQGSIWSDLSGLQTGYKSLSDTGTVMPTFKETEYYWNQSNNYPMSAGFDRLVDWEENSIFADPQLDRTTYQVASSSPALAQGFQQIDTASIGLFKDDPTWLALSESLSVTPLWGSGDWGDYTYANHNDPWEPAKFSNVAALTANTPTEYYKAASHLRSGNIIQLLGLLTPYDGGYGLFEYNTMSTATADNINIIKPLNFTYGRWIRQTTTLMSVAMFGAVGDGVTNDQPAIQAAIDYCSNNDIENLYFNSGVYYLSSTATGTGTPVANTNGVGYGAGENLNIGFYPEPLSAISYSTMYNNINYKPTNPKKINLNLIGTGSTILSARKEDRVTRFGGQASIIALRENINNFKMKGLSLLWDGYLTGDQEFQAQGVIIASNYGGAMYGRNVFWPIDRNKIDIVDCTFINCSRAISSGSSILSGRGTNTVNITGCNFLYPKGSDSTSTAGGSQVLLFGYDTLNLNITDNFAEGATTIPVNSPNYLAKDGFVVSGGINNRFERNTLTRFPIETIYGSTGSPALYCSSGSTLPAVGGTISLTAVNVRKNPGGGNYSSISVLTAYQGFNIGDIISYNYSSEANATCGVYIIDNLIEKSSTSSYEIRATRLSGANYGGEFANLRVATVGYQLSSGNFITPFNFQNKIGSKTYVLDNTFTAGLALSSPTLSAFAHQPDVRADAGYVYLSGNSMPGTWTFYGNGQTGLDFKTEWVIENNTFYCCSSATTVDLSNLNTYNSTVKNNDFYFWSDFINNNALVYTAPRKVSSGSVWNGVNINWGHNTVKEAYSLGADVGRQVVVDNRFYCTYPLSAATINTVTGTTKFDIVSGNTITNIYP